MAPHSPLTFRKADPEDAEHVRALVRAEYAKWVPVTGREPLPMVADYRRAIVEHRIDLMCEASNIVGPIQVEPRDNHLWIENIAVSPDWHGKGLGRRLLEHAESIAATMDLRVMRLLTNGAFDSNVALYQRVGFAIERTEPFMGGTTVHMSKSL